MHSILDSFKLDGKTAIVTGAARGLGQGMALALADAGANIVAVDILAAEDTKKQVEALGRNCVTIAANLGDRSSIPSRVAWGSIATPSRPATWRPITRIHCAPTPIAARPFSRAFPAGRWGTPEDLRGAMVFLASPASDYVNGYTIAVDGGWLAR